MYLRHGNAMVGLIVLDGSDEADCSTGGDPEECVEGYCPEGTYFDGYSCYDCDYCLNVDDDSACSAGIWSRLGRCLW